MMNKFNGSELNDVYILRNSSEKYNYISFDINSFMTDGFLTYFFKYLIWALDVGGVAEIIFNSSKSSSFSTREIRYWQIVSLLNTHFDDIEILNLSEDKLVIKKTKDLYKVKGVSFGIVFSGEDSEVDALIKSISSVYSNVDVDIPFEVIVSGPSNFDMKRILNFFKGKDNLKYLDFDETHDKQGRFLISKKKNYIYSKMKYGLRVLSHTRILYPSNFILTLSSTEIDIATTKIFDMENNPYLSFVLTGSLDTSKLNTAKPITGSLLEDNFLKSMKRRVAYTDGGLIIINSNVMLTPPFNPKLAWGEAEDMDLCKRASGCGLLIDYLPHLHCISMTNKIKRNFIRNNKITDFVRIKLVNYGIL